MSLKGRLLRIAAALGLAKKPDVEVTAGTASKAGEAKEEPPAEKKMRGPRAGAFSRVGTVTRPSGKRCRACGTGGHERLARHGQP